jgi:hypothetical protein
MSKLDRAKIALTNEIKRIFDRSAVEYATNNAEPSACYLATKSIIRIYRLNLEDERLLFEFGTTEYENKMDKRNRDMHGI